MENLERRLIRRALMQHKTTREAAKVLGLSQATLVQKMKRWEQG
ncbi:helix-turn-helix domain-containing protein [Escherichia coli]